VPEAPDRARQNQAPAWPGAGHLWRVGPSTRGATAPQRAQQVNFVVRRAWLEPFFVDVTLNIHSSYES
jgi:hypothetical protein